MIEKDALKVGLETEDNGHYVVTYPSLIRIATIIYGYLCDIHYMPIRKVSKVQNYTVVS